MPCAFNTCWKSYDKYYQIKIFIGTVNSLYRSSGKRVLPSSLRIGLFTVVVDDNLDFNGSSLTGTSHWHGSGVSVLQFPTEDNPGTVRLRPPFKNLSDEEKVLDFSILDSYTNVHDCNLSVKTAPYPKENVEILLNFYDDLKDYLKKTNCWRNQMA